MKRNLKPTPSNYCGNAENLFIEQIISYQSRFKRFKRFLKSI
jgi:hypothetical protein